MPFILFFGITLGGVFLLHYIGSRKRITSICRIGLMVSAALGTVILVDLAAWPYGDDLMIQPLLRLLN